jgi:hypothetical protein
MVNDDPNKGSMLDDGKCDETIKDTQGETASKSRKDRPSNVKKGGPQAKRRGSKSRKKDSAKKRNSMGTSGPRAFDEEEELDLSETSPVRAPCWGKSPFDKPEPKKKPKKKSSLGGWKYEDKNLDANVIATAQLRKGRKPRSLEEEIEDAKTSVLAFEKKWPTGGSQHSEAPKQMGKPPKPTKSSIDGQSPSVKPPSSAKRNSIKKKSMPSPRSGGGFVASPFTSGSPGTKGKGKGKVPSGGPKLPPL